METTKFTTNLLFLRRLKAVGAVVSGDRESCLDGGEWRSCLDCLRVSSDS